MPHFGFIVAVHGGRRVEQRHKPILPDVMNLAPALFHALEDILDVGRIDLQKPGMDDTGGHLLSTDGEIFAAGGKYLDHQGHNVVQRFLAELIPENGVFDVVLYQPGQIPCIQSALHIRNAGGNADRRILRCGD